MRSFSYTFDLIYPSLQPTEIFDFRRIFLEKVNFKYESYTLYMRVAIES